MGLLTEKEIEKLESFDRGTSGYFGKMADYLFECINNGIGEGRFTEDEARADLEIALWYSYAHNNMEEYEQYYRTARWMPASEGNAKGCGAWHYRYSVALMYCGRLDEALKYAQKAVDEEPSYPWGWLQLAKLKYHFGDADSAKDAVAKGLELVPGDYEFTVLSREIDKGCTLEQMEYHYIDPKDDLKLQEGTLPECEEKLALTAGIVCDEKALQKIKELFAVQQWTADSPYCEFECELDGQTVKGVFCMNEAAVSKLEYDWLKEQKQQILQGGYLAYEHEDGRYELERLIFSREESMSMVYKDVDRERRFTITGHKNPLDMDNIAAYLRRQSAQPGEQSAPGREILLYRQSWIDGSRHISYAHCYKSQDEDTNELYAVKHIGTAGEEGTEEYFFCGNDEQYDEYAEVFESSYSQQGYDEWPDYDYSEMVVQLVMEELLAEDDDREDFLSEEAACFCESFEEAIAQALDRTCLGELDSWRLDLEGGKINIKACAIDAQAACDAIKKAAEHVDMDGKCLKIAATLPLEEEYTLLYSSDQSSEMSVNGETISE